MKKPSNSCPVAQQYETLCAERSPFLRSAEQYSAFTLPYVVPQNGKKNTANQNQHGWQSIGAEGTNNLANKMTQTLFPVNQPFFALSLEPEMEDLESDELLKLNKLYKQHTQLMVARFRKMKLRSKLVLFMKHLIIAGNCCLVRDEERQYRLFGLMNYVVRRDHRGRVSILILKEKVAHASLREEHQKALLESNSYKDSERNKDRNKELDLYTLFEYNYKEGDQYPTVKMSQHIEGVELVSTTTDNKPPPAIVCRWNESDTEDYGRGHIEDYAGDLYVVNLLSKARATGAAIMMEVRHLVKTGASLSISEYMESKNGDFLKGDKDDIHTLQLQRYADNTLITDVLKEYTERLSRGFMLLQASIRDSERTTALEVTKVANELDLNKGGIYSTLDVDLQTPLAEQMLEDTTDIEGNELDDSFEPTIITGLDAIGHAGELDKITVFTQVMALPATWPEELQKDTDMSLLAADVAKHLTMSTGWLKSSGTRQQEATATVVNESAGALTQSMASQVGKNMGDQLTNKT